MIRQVSKKKGQLSKFTRQETILLFFYGNPSSLTVRDIAAKTKISRSTVQNYLKLFKEQELISHDNQWIDSWQNRLKKTHFYIEEFAASGLINHLENELAASAIILFGSFRKGESTKESDIDLFVECAREKKLDLKKFEKLLGHEIQLFTRPKITKLPTHLFNNVVNGIKLKGYFIIK